MRKTKRLPSTETPCSICGGTKSLSESGITREDGGKKYDCWRCMTCDYPIYVPTKTSRRRR